MPGVCCSHSSTLPQHVTRRDAALRGLSGKLIVAPCGAAGRSLSMPHDPMRYCSTLPARNDALDAVPTFTPTTCSPTRQVVPRRSRRGNPEATRYRSKVVADCMAGAGPIPGQSARWKGSPSRARISAASSTEPGRRRSSSSHPSPAAILPRSAGLSAMTRVTSNPVGERPLVGVLGASAALSEPEPERYTTRPLRNPLREEEP